MCCFLLYGLRIIVHVETGERLTYDEREKEEQSQVLLLRLFSYHNKHKEQQNGGFLYFWRNGFDQNGSRRQARPFLFFFSFFYWRRSHSWWEIHEQKCITAAPGGKHERKCIQNRRDRIREWGRDRKRSHRAQSFTVRVGTNNGIRGNSWEIHKYTRPSGNPWEIRT